MDFTDLSRLPLSLHEPPPIPGQPEAIQLLSEGATPRSITFLSPAKGRNVSLSHRDGVHFGVIFAWAEGKGPEPWKCSCRMRD